MFFSNKFTNKQMAEISKKLHILIKSGILIAKAFETIAKQLKNKKQKSLFQNIANKITAGYTLEQAIMTSDKENLLPDTFKKMLILVEKTGKYDEILIEMDRYYLKIGELQSEYKKIFAYPKFGLYFFLISLMLTNPSIFFIKVFPFIFIIITLYMLNENLVLSFIDSFTLKIPFISKIKKSIIEYNLVTIFYMMYEAAIPVNIIFKTMKDFYKYSYTRNEIDKMIKTYNMNRPISECFKASSIFSHEIISIVETGETTGTVGSVLKRSSQEIATLVSMKILNISKMISPILQISGSILFGAGAVLYVMMFMGADVSDMIAGLKAYGGSGK